MRFLLRIWSHSMTEQKRNQRRKVLIYVVTLHEGGSALNLASYFRCISWNHPIVNLKSTTDKLSFLIVEKHLYHGLMYDWQNFRRWHGDEIRGKGSLIKCLLVGNKTFGILAKRRLPLLHLQLNEQVSFSCPSYLESFLLIRLVVNGLCQQQRIWAIK